MIGVGVKNSTSDLFLNNCDEFLYYDDLVRREPSKARQRTAPSRPPAGGSTVGPVRTAAPASAPLPPAALADADSVPTPGPSLDKALDLVVETIDALAEERADDEHIWGSMVKQALKRRHPGFNERAHGFRSFNDLLLEGQRRGLVRLFVDEKKSGAYRVLPVE